MSKLTFFFSALLIILMAFSMIYISHDILNQVSKKNTTIDSFMVDAEYRKYDMLGQIHFTLNSAHMVHYQTHDSAYFTKPHLMGYTAERIPWQVDANSGKTIKGTHQVYFWDNVILKQLSYPHHPDTTTIQTTALTVFPYQSLGVTDKPVMITRPNSVAHGIGMRADFKSGMITLLAQARGSYDPKKD